MRKITKAIAVLVASAVCGATAAFAFTGVAAVTGAMDAYKGVIQEHIGNLAGSDAYAAQALIPDSTNASNAIMQRSAQIGSVTPTHYVSIGNDVSAIVEECMPSVVAITGTSEYQSYSWFGPSQIYEAESSGTGILIGENEEEFLIVTNNHVVEDTKSLKVIFIDDTNAEATIKGRDAESDIAVISVKKADLQDSTKEAIKIATIGDSDQLKVGQGVIAIGNALGFGQSVTVGYVSALNREVRTDQYTTRNLLQTDAAINPGNSGGALINMAGEVIGINSAKYSSTDVEGVGYAIPITKVMDIIENFSNRKTREVVAEEKQGYLGIQGVNVDAQTAQMYDMPTGAYIYKILPGTGAAESELAEKDIITKIDGQSISSMEDMKELLTHYEAGETVSVTVYRLSGSEYVEMTVEVTLKDSGSMKS